jgi:PPP family 3-phenylpropionic acid transporter
MPRSRARFTTSSVNQGSPDSTKRAQLVLAPIGKGKWRRPAASLARPTPANATEPILAMRSVSDAALAKFLFLFAFLYGAFGVHSPFFPSFLSARGLGPEAIGFVLAAGTAIRLVAAPVAGQIALLLMGLVSAAALAPLAPLADALALGAAKRLDATGCRAFDYGWVRGAGSAAFIAGSVLSGQVIGRFGLTAIVVLQAVLFAVACLFAFRVPEQRLPTAYDNPSPSSSAGSTHGIRRLLAIPLYRRIVLAAALVFGSHAMHDGFAVIRWREAGIGPELISLLWSESVAAEVVVFFFIGPRLLDRLGPARAAALCAAAGALRWVVMSQTAWVPALMFVQPLHGLTFAFLHLACLRLLSEIVPSSLAATALSVYGTLGAGMASVLLTLASGPLYGRLGPMGFLVMAALCAVAVPVALTLRWIPGRSATG